MSTRKSPKDRIPIPIAIKRRAAALQPEKSRNAILLPGEDASKFETLSADFHEYFRPANLVEVALITQMVSAC